MLSSLARALKGCEYIGKPLCSMKPITTKVWITEGKQKVKDSEVLEAEMQEELA